MFGRTLDPSHEVECSPKHFPLQTKVIDQLRHIPIKNKELLHLISPPRQVRHVCCPLNLFLNAPSVRSPRSTPATFQCCAAKGHQQQQYSHHYDICTDYHRGGDGGGGGKGDGDGNQMGRRRGQQSMDVFGGKEGQAVLFIARHLGQPQLHMLKLKLSALICSNVRRKFHHLYPSFCQSLWCRCKKKIPPFVSIFLSIFLVPRAKTLAKGRGIRRIRRGRGLRRLLRGKREVEVVVAQHELPVPIVPKLPRLLLLHSWPRFLVSFSP